MLNIDDGLLFFYGGLLGTLLFVVHAKHIRAEMLNSNNYLRAERGRVEEEFAKKPFEGDYDLTDDGLHLPTHNTKLAT